MYILLIFITAMIILACLVFVGYLLYLEGIYWLDQYRYNKRDDRILQNMERTIRDVQRDHQND